MELSGQAYEQVMVMPVKRFHDYIKWKVDLEEKKNQNIEESTNNGKDFKLPNMNVKMPSFKAPRSKKGR